jgi:hypothetical protein
LTTAQAGIPSPAPLAPPSEFHSVVRPFSGEAYATGFVQSGATIGPLGLAVLADGSVLASGGPGRNQLFHFTKEGGAVDTPLATLPFPVYDMALDASGGLWATTGGGPLLRLDPETGAILGRYGDGLTQSLAIQPGTGLLYISSGNGIEVFNPVQQSFHHYSNQRVGSLAFAPDGTLWAATWPKNQNQVVAFVGPKAKPQVTLQFDADVDSIAFGQPGSELDGLLFVSHDAEFEAGAGSQLTMVDLATLQQVPIASGGSRGDEIKTAADGRIFLSQSHQVDELKPLHAPRVASTNPPPDGITALPLGTISITFDQDMFSDSAPDPRSVTNPANYRLTGDQTGPITIRSVAYDARSRTAALSFDNLEADHYLIQVGTGVQSREGLALAQPYASRFTALSDFTAKVDIQFSRGRANALAHTVTYDVTVTN